MALLDVQKIVRRKENYERNILGSVAYEYCVLTYFLHLLLKLNWYMTIATGVFFLIAYPFHRKKQNQKKEQEKRFFEVMIYIDTLLYAFLREQKVEAYRCAIEETILLLQSENVQVALKKSRNHVPAVLKEDLEEFISRLEINPEDAEPYHDFLKVFALPEVVRECFSLAQNRGYTLEITLYQSDYSGVCCKNASDVPENTDEVIYVKVEMQYPLCLAFYEFEENQNLCAYAR